NSTFRNSGLKYRKGDLIVQNSNFDNSKIAATYGASKSSYVEIKFGCTVQNCEQEPAIYIDSYYNYTIDDCSISGNDGDGIGIFNSGGSTSTKRISNNIITNNGWGNLGSGIVVYRSYVQIAGAQLIEGNKYGISCFNNSNILIRGNSSANYTYETQIIRDNNKYQVYATQNSFPYYIQWNAIIDEDNQYPLVYYAIPPGFPEELDVRNNYWGNNFVPSLDLYPFNNYIYLPVWDLNSGSVGDDAEAKYNSAQAKIVQEDYTGAKVDFQQIINDYPTSKFAQAALRELFSLEENITDDYASLKIYYNTEANIQNNPDLAKLAEYLTNFCEIKLENYPTAILWFENVIQNPETIEDSIFAIIDLGYTYFLMENGGLKSIYSGNLSEHIPESKNQFEDKRDYLISLLYKDPQTNENLAKELSKLNEGELLQNFPNPFSGSTKIWYKLENESVVQLDIYNYAGQLISSFNEGTKPKGNHYINFDSSGLRNGIYFYSISINGQKTDSKKMTIMK
ncbi:MAG: T9SS type A sorting domain-containing protein, partial [Mariniphaga sp.]|nr:T9SS type A sorting domain-containing protein [Mariniphaga sp.]